MIRSRARFPHFAILAVASLAALLPGVSARTYYVALDGSDVNSGTVERPFATLPRALAARRQEPGPIIVRGGTYYLAEPLVLTARDSGTANDPTVIRAYPGEQPVISGGVRLERLAWRPYRDGIYQTAVPASLRTEELFVNGKRQILARYPNFDATAKYFGGVAADAIAKERVARWANPVGGYFHAMHSSLWGDFTWRITGKDPNGELTMEGGWQNNRPGPPHKSIRYVENIFEELDAPGEWFLDTQAHTLYFYPPAGMDMTKAIVEVSRLRSVIELRGATEEPVRFVTLEGLTIRHAARTMMETREPLLRTDWAIYRGGAVLFQGTEDCALSHCGIEDVGGNAVFVNNYNRRVEIRGCHITRVGASGICVIGDSKAARSPSFRYEQTRAIADLDLTPGPRTNNYPADCLIDDCLIHQTGLLEKQTAGVTIDLAERITVRHCSIYDVPRAGINIGDGCWGGHVVEDCDVFDTVRETGDHGAFNAWGRDRYWVRAIGDINARVAQRHDLPHLDVIEPITLRHNRWRCDHGWDIDLDDGASRYVIEDNLCLHGGIKCREGFDRIVQNNVIVDSGFFPHVWPAMSGDIFRKNIVWADYHPARMHPPPWGDEMDYNLRHSAGANPQPATMLQSQSGRDQHSLRADAEFVDAARGDYRVQSSSPALALGFVNFSMDEFGVRSPELKAIARTPELPGAGGPATDGSARDIASHRWLGALVRNVIDESEMSAYGLSGVAGIVVLEAPTGSPAARQGLRKGDVIVACNDVKTSDLAGLLDVLSKQKEGVTVTLGVSRDQKVITITLFPE